MKKAIVIIIITAMWGLFFAPAAQAELVIIAIEATVDYVEDLGNYLEGRISIGDIITGTYTYESTTPNTSSSPDSGTYKHYSIPYGIRLTVGGFVFETDPDNVIFGISIRNDAPWFEPDINEDSYAIGSDNNIPLSNGTLVGPICWWLDNPTGNALSNTDLPTTAPVLDHWQENELHLDGGRPYGIVGHVTSAILIPEPATILLLSIGVFLLRKRQHFKWEEQ